MQGKMRGKTMRTKSVLCTSRLARFLSLSFTGARKKINYRAEKHQLYKVKPVRRLRVKLERRVNAQFRRQRQQQVE